MQQYPKDLPCPVDTSLLVFQIYLRLILSSTNTQQHGQRNRRGNGSLSYRDLRLGYLGWSAHCTTLFDSGWVS